MSIDDFIQHLNKLNNGQNIFIESIQTHPVFSSISVQEGSIRSVYYTFYKCTYVNTASSTWSGKKLIRLGDAYQLAEEATTNMQYKGFQPEIGGIYNQNTSAKVASYTVVED